MAQIQNIKQQAIDNQYVRQVLETGAHIQVVIMSIPVGTDIGAEVHADNDQVLYLVEGKGQVVLGDETSDYNAGDLVLVPAGTQHNFIATEADLKIITTYSPAHHPEGTVHKTKAEAEAAE